MGPAALQQENARLREQLEAAQSRAADLQGQLQHRVRNLLGVLNAISRRTAELSRSPEEYMLHWDGRLAAITRAENVALRDPAGRVNLEELIAEELLANTAKEGEQLDIGGPPVAVAGRAVETVWLAIHELAVNSVKFGALLVGSGRISIHWDLIGDGAGKEVRLEWREQAGRGSDLQRRGFGTEVIEQMLAYELGGRGLLQYGPDGMFCSIRLPVDGELVSTAASPVSWQTPPPANVRASNVSEAGDGERGRQG